MLRGGGVSCAITPRWARPAPTQTSSRHPRSVGSPWLIRTFERGVEGETLACGTGTVAAAASLAAGGHATMPVGFLSRGGAPLSVAGEIGDGRASGVWLCGEGRLVFTGTLA